MSGFNPLTSGEGIQTITRRPRKPPATPFQPPYERGRDSDGCCGRWRRCADEGFNPLTSGEGIQTTDARTRPVRALLLFQPPYERGRDSDGGDTARRDDRGRVSTPLRAGKGFRRDTVTGTPEVPPLTFQPPYERGRDSDARRVEEDIADILSFNPLTSGEGIQTLSDRPASHLEGRGVSTPLRAGKGFRRDGLSG